MIHTGDCVEVMRGMEAESVDAIVTDPPYGLEFMGKEWDRLGATTERATDSPVWRAGHGGSGPASKTGGVPFGGGGQRVRYGVSAKSMQAWHEQWATEAFRVLKPGGYLLAFGGTRTVHRLASAIEDAGFEIRDELVWIYASGFPKSMDVGKAMDKRGGADISWFGPWLRQERERRGITQKSLAVHFPSKTNNLTGCVANWELGFNLPTVEQFNKLCEVLDLPFDRIEEAERAVLATRHDAGNRGVAILGTEAQDYNVTAASSDLARRWDGWGTALKPAHEPIVMARKPLQGTVAGNVAKWGTGALNIDGTRIGTEATLRNASAGTGDRSQWRTGNEAGVHGSKSGRWPSNILLSAPELFDESNPYVVGSGATTTSRASDYDWDDSGNDNPTRIAHNIKSGVHFGDSGGYSRFFIVPKSSRSDREPVLRDAAVLLHQSRGECDKLRAWERPDPSQPEQTDSTSPARAISASKPEADSSSDTSSSGKQPTDPSPRAIRSTTSTATSKTTDSTTSSSSIPSPTSVSTQGASSEAGNGGSPAGSAESSSLWGESTGTSPEKAGRSTDGAARATFGSSSKRNRCAVCGKQLPRVSTHPTQKPTDLMAHLIRLVTPPGGVILDPFLGSGSTAIAAERLGVKWIGIEREPDYVAIAEARLNGTQRGLGLYVPAPTSPRRRWEQRCVFALLHSADDEPDDCQCGVKRNEVPA